MITSRQLAEMAGVSRGTVDRVLNHRGGVRPEVQQLVERLARENGYVPNRAGKALVMRGPLRVDVLLNSVGNPFYDEVRIGLQDAAADYADFSLHIHVAEMKGYDPDVQLQQLEIAKTSGAAGVILTPLNHPAVAAAIDDMTDNGCPVVALNSDLEGCRRLAYVGCDYIRSGQTAAHILGLVAGGSGKVLAVTGSLEMLGHSQRIAGFREVLQKEYPAMNIVEILENNDDEQRSARLVAQTLKCHRDVTALYFAAGGVAGGVDAAGADGVRRTIIACDLTPESRRMLEAGRIQVIIGQQPYWQGHTAMKLLLDHLLLSRQPGEDCCYARNEILTKYNA